MAAPSDNNPEGPLVHFFGRVDGLHEGTCLAAGAAPPKFGGEAGFTAFIKDTVKKEYGVDHVRAGTLRPVIGVGSTHLARKSQGPNLQIN